MNISNVEGSALGDMLLGVAENRVVEFLRRRFEISEQAVEVVAGFHGRVERAAIVAHARGKLKRHAFLELFGGGLSKRLRDDRVLGGRFETAQAETDFANPATHDEAAVSLGRRVASPGGELRESAHRLLHLLSVFAERLREHHMAECGRFFEPLQVGLHAKKLAFVGPADLVKAVAIEITPVKDRDSSFGPGFGFFLLENLPVDVDDDAHKMMRLGEMFQIVMQNFRQYFRQISGLNFGRMILAGGLLALGACASVPAFKPSKPINQAQSLQEGLLLCNEYRLPVEPKRPVTLRPFLSCLDDLQDQFPGAANGSLAFKTFLTEFHLSYSVLSDARWTQRLGTELDVAIHAVLRALWQPATPTVTPLERELVLQNFPATAQRLGAANWTVATQAVFDPQLEALKAGVASFSEGEALQESQAVGVSVQQSPEVGILCEAYFRLRRETNYLSNLWRDQYDFSMLAPQSPVSATVRAKYTKRLDDALRELEILRPQIAEARVKDSFRVLACRH